MCYSTTSSSVLGSQLFATERLHTEPLPFDQARSYVARHHRHNAPPVGHVFSVGCYFDGVLVGVAIVGRPVARALDNGYTLEVTRVCTQGHPDACSKLYAACQQRARLRGYRLLITYTLQSEKASSVRAANFTLASGSAGAACWSGKRQVARRSSTTAQELKCRWEFFLNPAGRKTEERDAYTPWVQHKQGGDFDWLIFPGRAFIHQSGLSVPAYPVEALALVGGAGPSAEQLRDLHELAGAADRAGYQLMLARHNSRFPFHLTTCRDGSTHRRAIQWGDTHLSGGDRLRVYLGIREGSFREKGLLGDEKN